MPFDSFIEPFRLLDPGQEVVVPFEQFRPGRKLAALHHRFVPEPLEDICCMEDFPVVGQFRLRVETAPPVHVVRRFVQFLQQVKRFFGIQKHK